MKRLAFGTSNEEVKIGLVVLRRNKFLDLFVQRTPNAWRWGR
jgi:hypothetical protein